jgi:hypothetical protein
MLTFRDLVPVNQSLFNYMSKYPINRLPLFLSENWYSIDSASIQDFGELILGQTDLFSFHFRKLQSNLITEEKELGRVLSLRHSVLTLNVPFKCIISNLVEE